MAEPVRQTLAFGQFAEVPGLHVMEAPSGRWAETLSGLGGTGVHMVLAWRPPQKGAPVGHPMVPTLTIQILDSPAAAASPWADIILPGDDPGSWLPRMLRSIQRTASGDYVPCALRNGNVDFQIPRGQFCSL
uniref:Uncharacterized protein n=1 Tax=Haptolina ericina TaxID=156174 RepID=A0A7S3BUG1_9EUKA